MIKRSAIAIGMILVTSMLPACSGSDSEEPPEADVGEQSTESIDAQDPAPVQDLSMPAEELRVEIGAEPIRTFAVEVQEGVAPVDIEVYREGEGAACPNDAVARIAFVAKLADDTVWDSSERRRFTLAVPLGEYGTIPGLRAAITGMKPGEIRRARIPWQLGYGEQGRAPIPPETDLIFDIRLVGFEPIDSDAQ